MIQQLLGHLDANSRSPASVRAGIVEVLSEAAAIEASGSVGQYFSSFFLSFFFLYFLLSALLCSSFILSLFLCHVSPFSLSFTSSYFLLLYLVLPSFFLSSAPPFISPGPTVLEVFNTLLRQLRQSVDYQLTGYYDNAAKHKTTSAEERTLQDAVIKTIGR